MPRKTRPCAAQDAVLEATQLLGKWTRLAQGHVVFGAGCACGLGPGNLQLQDFEQQILDYLDSKYRAAGNEAVAGLLQARAGYKAGESGSVQALLRSIAGRPAGELGGWLPLLADLRRSLESFEDLHRSR